MGIDYNTTAWDFVNKLPSMDPGGADTVRKLLSLMRSTSLKELNDILLFVNGTPNGSRENIAERISERMYSLAQALPPIQSPTPMPPIPMILICPGPALDGRICGRRHVDVGDFATLPHHTHSCQFCGHSWRPAEVDTIGVEFLPRFKNDEDAKVTAFEREQLLGAHAAMAWTLLHFRDELKPEVERKLNARIEEITLQLKGMPE
jgi:hypothetical protein